MANAIDEVVKMILNPVVPLSKAIQAFDSLVSGKAQVSSNLAA